MLFRSLNFMTGNWFSFNEKKIYVTRSGYTVSGSNGGVDRTASVSGEVLSFLSTGIDTRVYFIKNF